MSDYNPSSDLWTLLYDVDQALGEHDESPDADRRRALLRLQRRQVCILLKVHCPDEFDGPVDGD